MKFSVFLIVLQSDCIWTPLVSTLHSWGSHRCNLEHSKVLLSKWRILLGLNLREIWWTPLISKFFTPFLRSKLGVIDFEKKLSSLSSSTWVSFHLREIIHNRNLHIEFKFHIQLEKVINMILMLKTYIQ